MLEADGTYTGTVTQQGVVTTESGTWSTDGKKVTFKLQDGTTTTLDYTITGNKLVVSETISTPFGENTPANLEFTKQ
ncbi:MAG: lipocalin family protein [Ignavibacteriales bacterium]|nr:lipocalin family protein [Ignavibacteriales bacterium]